MQEQYCHLHIMDISGRHTNWSGRVLSCCVFGTWRKLKVDSYLCSTE